MEIEISEKVKKFYDRMDFLENECSFYSYAQALPGGLTEKQRDDYIKCRIELRKMMQTEALALDAYLPDNELIKEN